jgi:hypothetical protein
MNAERINLQEKLSLFEERWSPRIVAQMNDYHFKLAKIQGEFVWHSHPETEEVFIVLAGGMYIEFQDTQVEHLIAVWKTFIEFAEAWKIAGARMLLLDRLYIQPKRRVMNG